MGEDGDGEEDVLGPYVTERDRRKMLKRRRRRSRRPHNRKVRCCWPGRRGQDGRGGKTAKNHTGPSSPPSCNPQTRGGVPGVLISYWMKKRKSKGSLILNVGSKALDETEKKRKETKKRR